MPATETLNNLLPKFIKHLIDKGRSPSTILAYRADLEQLLEYLKAKEKVTTDNVTQSDIESFRDSLLNQKYTTKSVSRKLNAVKTFFRWLSFQKRLSLNPAEDVAHPKIQLGIPKYLSPLEYRA